MTRLGWATSAALALAIASAPGLACAKGVDDGNAGLDALNRGAYDEAIRLFTRALSDKSLAASDKEFAYVNRADARAAKGDRTAAAADYRAALKLKPDDAEAKAGLDAVAVNNKKTRAGTIPMVQPAVAQAAPPPPPRAPSVAETWGALGGLAGTTWLEIDKNPEVYLRYKWEQPGAALAFAGMDRRGNVISGRFVRDPASGAITETLAFKNTSGTAQVEVAPEGFALNETANGVPIRQAYVKQNADLFQLTQDAYTNGAWKTAKTTRYVRVNDDMVQALNWKPSAGSKFSDFLSGLGNALAQGALAGLADGLQGSAASAPPQQ